MKSRKEFSRKLAGLGLTAVDFAVAFLWYYSQTQEFEERSASELASDLRDEGFSKPNVTRLNTELRRNPSTVKGKRRNTFQVNIRKASELDTKYKELLGTVNVSVTDSILSKETFTETRLYLENMCRQVNGTYDYGFYDACAVLCRRLMESLIIEIYVKLGRHNEIQHDGMFISLERIIGYIRNDKRIVLGRNSGKTMEDIKELGDTAAHDRTYIIRVNDIDDIKFRFRKLIDELLILSELKK